MNNMQFKKSKNSGLLKGKSFYIALGICLIAVGAAAFTTYENIHNFVKADDKPPIQSQENSSQSVSDPQSHESSTLEHTKDKPKEKILPSQKQNPPQEKPTPKEPEKTEAVNASPESKVIVYPGSKEIIKPFSAENPLYSKTLNDWRTHNGIDLKASQGDMVKAITDGVVKDIYEDPLLGMTISIDHGNNMIAYYSGLGDTTLVNKEDKVETGKEIGSINDIPSEIMDGYHLHFSIQKDGKWIDPVEILGSPE